MITALASLRRFTDPCGAPNCTARTVEDHEPEDTLPRLTSRFESLLPLDRRPDNPGRFAFSGLFGSSQKGGGSALSHTNVGVRGRRDADPAHANSPVPLRCHDLKRALVDEAQRAMGSADLGRHDLATPRARLDVGLDPA